MGFFSEDMISMLDTYRMEAAELMDIFDKIVVAGEKRNDFTTEEINEIFRTAHTIKSSSAMMGLMALSHLTHHMEDLFSIYREKPERIKGRVSDIAEIFYSYSDYVKNELRRMEQDDYQPETAETIEQALTKEIGRTGSAEPTPETGKPPQTEAGTTVKLVPASGQQELTIFFTDDCPMVNVKSLVIIKKLQSLCVVLKQEPANLTDSGAAAWIHEKGLHLILQSADMDPVWDALQHNSYIRKVETDSEATAPDVPAEAAEAVPAVANDDGTDELASITSAQKFLSHQQDQYISLRWDDVVRIQNIAGEFLSLQSLLQRGVAHSNYVRELSVFSSSYGRLLDELGGLVHGMSMLPVSTLAPQLHRIVREISKAEEKEVVFEVQGGHIEIDRNLFDHISKPLLHIIRNSIDHGIEDPAEREQQHKARKGKIVLTVENQGSRVVFCVRDDGKGMDPAVLLAKGQEKGLLKKPAAEYTKEEALRLIMLPGFSTSQTVTSYSGRGVGMDVVYTIANSFGGVVSIESETGKGTAITLNMPVSVTAVQSLSFFVAGVQYYVPLHSVDRLYAAQEAAGLVQEQDGLSCFVYGKKKLPLLSLRSLYGLPAQAEGVYLVMHSFDYQFCLAADAMAEQVTALEKNLPSCLDQTYQEKTGICNCVIGEEGFIGYALNAAILYKLCSRKDGIRL